MLIDPGGEHDPAALPLYTRARTRIPNEQRRRRDPAHIREFVADMGRSLPNAIPRSVIGGIYNCIGLIFGTRRTWIEPEHLAMILADDGYRRLKDTNQVEVGDVVEYHFNDKTSHVGVVVCVQINPERAVRQVVRVLSKWGDAAEYLHRPEDVPFFLGAPVAYWTEREVP